MSELHLFLGIDIGTSGIRAVIINQDKNIVATAQQALPPPLKIEHNGVEQHPDIWWQTFVDVLHALCNQISLINITCIAVDGTSGTVLVADKTGTPLAPALMYNDGRCQQQVKELDNIAPAHSPVHQLSAGLPKLMWLYEQSFANNIRFALHQTDWITGKLTGNYATCDSNNCLKTGCDPINNTWPEWINKTNLPVRHLPKIIKPGTQVNTILPDIAEQLGLPTTTQIIAGTTDSTAAIIATGAHQTGDAITSLGSTLVVKVIHDKPISDSAHGIYSQPLYIAGELKWLVGGASNSGGAVLRQYFSDGQVKKLSEQIDLSRPCPLSYYPLPCVGERFPVNAPDRQSHLSPRPDNDAEFLYGILTGIANIEKNGYRRLSELGAPYPKRVFSVGGGSINPVWSSIRQSLLGTEMLIPQHTDAAYGSALLALQGCTS